MPKTLGEQLKEEVDKRRRNRAVATRKRYLQERIQKIAVCILSTGVLFAAIKTIYSPVNIERMVPGMLSSKSNLQAINPPKNGIIDQYRPSELNKTGVIRFFARAPIESDRSSLSSGCKQNEDTDAVNEDERIKNKNIPGEERLENYYIELLDWKSDKVVLTAFVRKDSMTEFLVPFGTYKVRYASGQEWYGETDLFGYQTLYEMTETLPMQAAKMEISNENLGIDIGFRCGGGNLGREPVDKDSGKKGIPVKPNDSIRSI